jgi:uracil-DNA glycosylase
MNFADGIIAFNRNLQLNAVLPDEVLVMNPFDDKMTRIISEKFYRKFYKDHNQRTLILGINPGRFGAGLTGIPFTDPVKLEKNCGIKNNLNKITEPSAGFIYDMITAFGGPETFYNSYLIHAVCPLGFTKNGVNYNYYDSKALEKAVTPFIIGSLKKIVSFRLNKDICFCLGNGKNFRFLSKLNEDHNFFKEVLPLPHPRWIVQYRRKRYQEFIEEYLKWLKDEGNQTSASCTI